MSLEKTKVLVIGLDGADFKFIHPLIKQGRLPNLAKFLKQGAHSELATVVPPVSPSAWTSFSTGKLPSNHGIYSFFINQDNQSIPSTFCNSKNIKGKTIWELLSEAGKNSIIIDVPLQYPPLPIKGIMISRFMSESLAMAFYPSSLYRHLRQKGFNLLDSSCCAIAAKKYWNLKKHLKSIENKVSLIRYLSERNQWDLFVVVFQETDIICHLNWREPKKIKAIYEKLDWALGEIFKLVGAETIKFIISDHGFREVEGYININEILFELGYLTKTMSRKALAYFLRTGKSEKKVKVKGKNFKVSINYRYDSLSSKAYCASGLMYGININLIGRNTKGKIRFKDYNKICKEIITELKQVRDPITKEELFERVWQNNLAFKHRAKNFPPDIYFIPHRMKYQISAQPIKNKQDECVIRLNNPSGFHDLYGIFIALGQGIKSAKLNNIPSLLDLGPTILHILDVPIPYDLDGKILTNIFSNDSTFLGKKSQFQKSSVIKRKAHKISEKKQKIIFEQLKKLGYLR